LLTGYLLNFESLYCPFIGYLSYALEEIHEEKSTDVSGISALAQSQLLPDFYAEFEVFRLISIRNDAVHHNKEIEKADFEDFIRILLRYLLVGYTEYISCPTANEIDDEPAIEVKEKRDLSHIRGGLVEGEDVEVKVISHINNFVTFYIDNNETAFIFSQTIGGDAIIPKPNLIKPGSVIKIRKHAKRDLSEDEKEDRGLIYKLRDGKRNPLLSFVEVVRY
jgi:hypothetical protein